MLKTNFLTFLFVCFLIAHTVANADQITSFIANGGQCAVGVGSNGPGKIGLGIRNSSGSLIFMLLNADGTILKTREITADGAFTPWSVAVTNDNGFAVVGSIATPSNGTDGWIAKFSGTGGLVWKKTLGTPENDEFRIVRVLNDGSIIATGHHFSSTTDVDLLMARFSRAGALMWRKVIGANGLEHVGDEIAILNDDSFVIPMSTEVQGELHALWVRMDRSGNILWSRAVETADSLGLFYLPAPGGYILGYLSPLRQDADGKTFIARFDNQDRRLWSKSFGIPGHTLSLRPGFVLDDQSFLLTGNAFDPNASLTKAVLLKISKMGGVQWKRNYNVDQRSTALFNGVKSADSESIVSAGCVGFNTTLEDVILVQLPLTGSTSCSGLRTIPVRNSNAPFSWSDFPLNNLSAEFHTATFNVRSTNFPFSLSTECP
jgi:hypothetical protein